MTETLVPNGDGDDELRLGVAALELIANDREPLMAERRLPHPQRLTRVDILIGHAGISGASAEADMAEVFRRKPRSLPYPV